MSEEKKNQINTKIKEAVRKVVNGGQTRIHSKDGKCILVIGRGRKNLLSNESFPPIQEEKSAKSQRSKWFE